jgi:hypothetical protein
MILPGACDVRIFIKILSGTVWSIFFFIIFILSPPASSLAWRGKIVDIETGEPIEGVAVVRSWRLCSLSPAGQISRHLGTKAGFSDKKGKLKIRNIKTPFLIPIIEWIEEEKKKVYKPGYKYLEVDNKTKTIQLTKLPTFPMMRKIEWREAFPLINIPLTRDLIENERTFLDTSLYLIDARVLVDEFKNSTRSSTRAKAAKQLGATLDTTAVESLINSVSDKEVLLPIEALVNIKSEKSVEYLIGKIGTGFRRHDYNAATKALVQIGAPAVEYLCRVFKVGF